MTEHLKYFISQISRCAKSDQFQATQQEQEKHSLLSLKQWHGVAVMSEEEPRLVMEFLLSVQQFDLAVDWAELHNLPGHFHKVRYFKSSAGSTLVQANRFHMNSLLWPVLNFLYL